MSEIDVSKCKYYLKKNKMDMCKACNSGVGTPYCEYDENCYYKQLQKSQNTIIVGLQIQTMLLANNSKLNKCLDEIEEYIDNFCENVCPYYVDEGESCDNCILDDIVQPIEQKIKEVKGND